MTDSAPYMNLMIIEIAVILIFAASVFFAYRTRKLDILVYATVFAAFFENANVMIFRNVPGGYHYSSDFAIFLLETPLVVILSWGIIILSSYTMAKRIGADRIGTVLLVPILADLIDLAIEAMFVHLGFWTWHGFDGYMMGAVAPANFIGWLGVSLGFIAVYEYSNRKWLSMFLGYPIFLLLSGLSFAVSLLLSLEGTEGYLVFALVFAAIYAAYLIFGKTVKRKSFNLYDKATVATRLPFYAIALFMFIYYRFYTDAIMTAILAAVLAFECYYWYRCYRKE